METTAPATKKCLGPMSDPSAMPHVRVTPTPQSQQDNQAAVVIALGPGEGTLTIETKEEAQLSLVQILIPSSTDDLAFGDAQVRQGDAQSDVAVSETEKPSEEGKLIQYDLLEAGVGYSPDGVLVTLVWTSQPADKDVTITLVLDGCFKSGESLRRIHVHYSWP